MKHQQQLTNATGQERILRNTSYLTIAFVLQKILSFVYFIFISKALGAYNLGFYDPAKALIPILLILIDFSLSPVLTREIARKPEKSFTYLSNVLAIKAIFSTILLVSFGVITNFVGFNDQQRSLYYLVALIVAFDSFTNTFYAVFRGLQNMKYEAYGMILTQLATFALGMLSLQAGYGLKGIFLSTLLGSVTNFVYAFYFLRKNLGIAPSFKWSKSIIKTFLVTAIPFAAYAILAKVFTYTDRLVLLLVSGQLYVGYYATAYKLTFALEFLPSSFAAAFYPAMSAYFVQNKEKLARTFERSLMYLIILSIPISAGGFILAHNIFNTLWAGSFSNSILAFKIMILSLVAIFCNFPVGSLLFATNNQRWNTINMAITVLVNIVLNLLLVNTYAHVGAAIATVSSMFLLFFLGLFQSYRVTHFKLKPILRTLLLTVFVSLVSAAAIYIVRSHIPLYCSIAAFAVIYIPLLFICRVVTRNDIAVILGALGKKRV